MTERVFGDAFSRICAALAVFGSVTAIATDVIGVMVHDETGFVADTISDLAAGRHAWIQDAGLYAFAFGLAAVAAAMLRAPVGGFGWRIGGGLLIVLSVVIAVIGGYGEYGDNDAGGLVIHIYLVVALGIGFAVAVACLTPGLMRLDGGRPKLNVALVVAWSVAAPIFFLVPTSWDGLYERGVAGLMILWVLCAAALIRRPRNVRRLMSRTLAKAY